MAKKINELKFINYISVNGEDYVPTENLTPKNYDEVMAKLLDNIMKLNGYIKDDESSSKDF